jgi:cysteinyl-tRNA synthetase
MYVCGITPYDVTHLGHASTFLWADLAARVLRATGTPVSVTRNVTDVDESLLAAAERRGEPYDELAARQRFGFDTTMSALGVRLPDSEPTARGTIGPVLALVAALLDEQAAYVAGGSVYARTSAAVDRAGLDLPTAIELAREFGDEPDDPAKDSPLDTAVWRGARSGEVAWPSPWGPGRPGWHAQCSAMVLNTYGAGVDLHAGGADLRFPHHAVEALLAETVTGVTPFARAWLRPGVVHVGGAKMAKSSGNLVLVDDLLRTYTAAVIRLLCLNRPVSEDWSYEPAALERAAATVEDIREAAGRPTRGSGVGAVDAALLDGLDVPRALEVALEAGGAAAQRLADVLVLR